MTTHNVQRNYNLHDSELCLLQQIYDNLSAGNPISPKHQESDINSMDSFPASAEWEKYRQAFSCVKLKKAQYISWLSLLKWL